MAIRLTIFLTLCGFAVTQSQIKCDLLRNCTTEIATIIVTFHEFKSPDKLRNACQTILPMATSCVLRETPNCQNPAIVDDTRRQLRATGYVCLNDTRSEFISVQQSPCGRNATVRNQLREGTEPCRNSYLVDSRRLSRCQALANSMTCSRPVHMRLCGEVRFRLMRSFTNLVLGCSTDCHSRSSRDAKRSLREELDVSPSESIPYDYWL